MNGRIEKLLAFLTDTPNDCFLNHALALEYVKQEEDSNALGYFEKNLDFDPNYIATYYHLGKLYERMNDPDSAVAIYAKGMERARAAGDMHTYSELQNAHEDLVY
jgi:Tfp pilus assembly protein PilF